MCSWELEEAKIEEGMVKDLALFEMLSITIF